MTKKRNVIVTEDVAQAYVDSILTEGFIPSVEKVRLVKQYLDKHFKNASLYNMTPRELLLMVDDEFVGMMKDENDRRKFLKQIIRDWSSGKLKDDGVLSVSMYRIKHPSWKESRLLIFGFAMWKAPKVVHI